MRIKMKMLPYRFWNVLFIPTVVWTILYFIQPFNGAAGYIGGLLAVIFINLLYMSVYNVVIQRRTN